VDGLPVAAEEALLEGDAVGVALREASDQQRVALDVVGMGPHRHRHLHDGVRVVPEHPAERGVHLERAAHFAFAECKDEHADRRVVERQPELLLTEPQGVGGGPVCGHVGEAHDDPDDLTRCAVEHRHSGHGQPARLVVRGMDADQLAAQRATGPKRLGRRKLITGIRRPVRVHSAPPHVGVDAADELVGRHSEDAFRGRVGHDDLTGGVLHHDAVTDRIEQRGVQALAGREREPRGVPVVDGQGVGQPCGRHVGHQLEQRGVVVGEGVRLGGRHGQHRDRETVGDHGHDDERADGQSRREGCVAAIVVARVMDDDALPGLPEPLGRRTARSRPGSRPRAPYARGRRE
jgi:hypothetical protein